MLAILLFAVVSFVGIVAASNELRENLKNRITQVNHGFADFGAKAIAYQTRRRWQNLRASAAQPVAGRQPNERPYLTYLLTAAGNGDRSAPADLLVWLKKEHEIWNNRKYPADYWAVLDSKGRCVCRSDSATREVEREMDHSMRQIISGNEGDGTEAEPRPAMSRPFASFLINPSKQLRLVISIPVYADNDQRDAIGVLAMIVDPDRFQTLPTEKGGHREAMLVDANDNILQHSELPKKNGKRTGKFTPGDGSNKTWREKGEGDSFDSHFSLDDKSQLSIACSDAVSLLSKDDEFAEFVSALNWRVVVQESYMSVEGPVEILWSKMLYPAIVLSVKVECNGGQTGAGCGDGQPKRPRTVVLRTSLPTIQDGGRSRASSLCCARLEENCGF